MGTYVKMGSAVIWNYFLCVIGYAGAYKISLCAKTCQIPVLTYLPTHDQSHTRHWYLLDYKPPNFGTLVVTNWGL